jgi:hypothetical protein
VSNGLRIRGNVFINNATNDQPLGLDACINSNAACNTAQVGAADPTCTSCDFALPALQHRQFSYSKHVKAAAMLRQITTTAMHGTVTLSAVNSDTHLSWLFQLHCSVGCAFFVATVLIAPGYPPPSYQH